MRLSSVLTPPPRRARPLDEWAMVIAGAAVVAWNLLAVVAALGVGR